VWNSSHHFFDSITALGYGMLRVLKTPGTSNHPPADERYPTGELVRRLVALAWRFRADCLWSLVLSVVLLLLGIAGLKLLGVVIDVIRYALDPSLPPPVYPFGWNPPAGWSALQIVTALALAIVAQAVLRAALTYTYNMITARLTQGEIVPELRAQLYAKLQRLSFSFFDLHGSNSIFNRVTGDVQNTRLFVDGVLLQGATMILTLAAYVADSSVADCGVPVSIGAVVVAGTFLFGAAASGLPAQPRTDGQHDFAVQRECARDADGEGVRCGTAPGPAV
jgi:ABC-type multidrug transport system fused ATPase/permease subunit